MGHHGISPWIKRLRFTVESVGCSDIVIHLDAVEDEDLEITMYSTTLSTLRSAGLERYEVSNYARPGDEARDEQGGEVRDR